MRAVSEDLRQLGKDSIVYGIGGAISAALAFLLVPILTRIFTPAEYGALEMLLVISGFASLLLTLGLDAAQSFYFFEQKPFGKEAQAPVISAIFQWRLIAGCGILLALFAFMPWLNRTFFENTLTWNIADDNGLEWPHSRGGGVVLLTAARAPRAKCVVTWASISTFLRYTERAREEWRRRGRLDIPNARTGQLMWLDRAVLEDLEARQGELEHLVAQWRPAENIFGAERKLRWCVVAIVEERRSR